MADEFDPMTGEAFLEATEGADRLSRAYGRLGPQMHELQRTANGFARAITSAFAGAVTGGRQFDDVLKSLVLRLSDMALKAAFAPLSAGLASGINNLFSGLFGGVGRQVTAASGAIKPFAAGGVIGAPTYYPFSAGGIGGQVIAASGAIKPFAAGGVIGAPTYFPFSAGGIGGQVTAAGGAIKPFAAGGVISAPAYFPLSAGGIGLAGEAGPEAIMPLARGPDGRLGISTVDGSGPTQVTINISTPDAASFRGAEVYLTGQIARAVSRGQRGL